MRHLFACLGACCVLCAAGCGDQALKDKVATLDEKVNALEKENKELKSKLQKAQETETAAKSAFNKELAAREQCAKNLKQISLALHKFEGEKIPAVQEWKTNDAFSPLLPYLTEPNPVGDKPK